MNSSTADYLWVGGHYPVWAIGDDSPTGIEKPLRPLLNRWEAHYFNGHVRRSPQDESLMPQQQRSNRLTTCVRRSMTWSTLSSAAPRSTTSAPEQAKSAATRIPTSTQCRKTPSSLPCREGSRASRTRRRSGHEDRSGSRCRLSRCPASLHIALARSRCKCTTTRTTERSCESQELPIHRRLSELSRCRYVTPPILPRTKTPQPDPGPPQPFCHKGSGVAGGGPDGGPGCKWHPTPLKNDDQRSDDGRWGICVSGPHQTTHPV